MKIAFHTPLNRLEDGAVSGDRRMAAQLLALLRRLGHEVEPIEDARSYMREPDGAALDRHREHAAARVKELLEQWRSDGKKPDLWFTYRPYYKAPDLIGPDLCEILALPYVTAEASDSARRASGPWADHVTAARRALLRSDVHFCLTARDKAGLAALLHDTSGLVDLPPFLGEDTIAAAIAYGGARSDPSLSGEGGSARRAETGGVCSELNPDKSVQTPSVSLRLPPPPERGGSGRAEPFNGICDRPTPASEPLRLITVAMMRAGVKLESYQNLAKALISLADLPWTLTIVGDGAARPAVEQAFSPLKDKKIKWRGAVPHSAVMALLTEHDVFVWPGLGEGYGLVYLEAQAAGLPVVAYASGGVADTMLPGQTGLLVPERDTAALAGAIAAFHHDRGLRDAMGQGARAFIHAERTPKQAAVILEQGLALALKRFRDRATPA